MKWTNDIPTRDDIGKVFWVCGGSKPNEPRIAQVFEYRGKLTLSFPDAEEASRLEDYRYLVVEKPDPMSLHDRNNRIGHPDTD